MMQKFKVTSTDVIKFALVETNFGVFRVATNGNLTKFNDALGDFDRVDRDDFADWELAAVEQAGRDAMFRDSFKI